MTEIKPLANSLQEASIELDGLRPLAPGTSDYARLYVERPRTERVESALIREATRAARGQPRPFFWCFTGHTGSGKSTELNRLMSDDRLSSYLSIYIDLEVEFDLQNVTYQDLFLAVGRACAERADELECPVPDALAEAIHRWGSEVFTEEELQTRTEGHAGLKVSLPFLALGEEVRSGGGQREVIRTNIATDVLEFTRLINQLAKTLEDTTGRRVLCVLDGLDHADAKLAFELLNEHFRTLTLPKISQIFVVPLALLNTSFLATIERRYSTVPNIKVFRNADSQEIDAAGYSFFKDVISRYAPLEFFSGEALASLCRLSAGIVREMIRNTGEACAYAADRGATHVAVEHVEPVWNQVMRFYRNQLRAQDYEVLRQVDQLPLIQGIDGVPPLLDNKALVYYPNGEGWYGVHPAVLRMIRPSARDQR